MDNTPDKSLNMTQLLFSPGATGGQVLHSIFSPPLGGKSLRDVGTDVDDFVFSPISHVSATSHYSNQHDQRVIEKRIAENEISVFGKHTFADAGRVDSAIHIGSEKENIDPVQQLPPPQQAEPPIEIKSNPKTPAKTFTEHLDDSSVDSMGEFHTPCPKTPGAESASKQFTHDDISYESLNTTRESKDRLLSSFGNSERGRWEQGNVWEQIEDDDESSQEMVFVTPKQRAEKRENGGSNGSSISEVDEFFSPLAQYPSDNDEVSSMNLVREAKNMLAAKPLKHLSVIQDDSCEDEFFSPLAQHVPSDHADRQWSYEEVGSNDNAEQPEEGSTYRLIHDVKNILASSKSDASREPVLVQHSAAPTSPTLNHVTMEQPEEQPVGNVETDRSAKGTYAENVNSQIDSQLTPTPEVAQIQLTSENITPNIQQSPLAPHLHSPSVCDLPTGALSVDFVRKCDCIETLKTILVVLNGSKKGKQLRQPRLKLFVQKRLLKLGYSKDDTASVKSEEQHNINNAQGEHQWQQFQSDSKWNVKLPPRTAIGRMGGKRIMWSEDVKDNESSVATGISLQSSLSFESIIQESKRDISMNETGISNPVLITPKVVEVTDMPVPTSSPSIHLSSIAESSLDMNLSDTFTLGDESAYWKMGIPEERMEEADEAPASAPSQREIELCHELESIHKAYEEAKADVSRLSALLETTQEKKARQMILS